MNSPIMIAPASTVPRYKFCSDRPGNGSNLLLAFSNLRIIKIPRATRIRPRLPISALTTLAAPSKRAPAIGFRRVPDRPIADDYDANGKAVL